MSKFDPLTSVLILMGGAIAIVMLFKRLRLSPVLGYLATGAIIGDHGLKIITFKDTHFIAEFGVVFLLFAIGLELSFERLKAMRKYVFGLGSLQIICTSATITGILLLKWNSNVSLIIAMVFSLSSTAIVLQVVQENHLQSKQVGRVALAILLQQDFIVVPLLVVIPLLSSNSDLILLNAILSSFVKALIALVLIFICGRLFLRPVFHLISFEDAKKNNELFIAGTLFISLSAAWITEYMGLSLTLGAFVAGILVAETEFRASAEESIYPFKELLLGLFFMTVGMSINAQELADQWGIILLFSFGLILIKSLIITGLCLLFGFSKGTAIHSGLLLSQGSEFAFILVNLGISNKLIPSEIGHILLLVVTLSMAITPLLSNLGSKLENYFDSRIKQNITLMQLGTYDLTNHVIIAGFGDVGKMIAKMLEIESVNYVIIDIDESAVITGKQQGFPIFQGDVSQKDTLTSLGANRALCVVMAINNQITIKKSLKSISANFPELTTIIRVYNLNYASELYAIGANVIVPENYEMGLQLGGKVLSTMGISEYEVNRIKEQFRTGNYIANKEHDTH